MFVCEHFVCWLSRFFLLLLFFNIQFICHRKTTKYKSVDLLLSCLGSMDGLNSVWTSRKGSSNKQNKKGIVAGTSLLGLSSVYYCLQNGVFGESNLSLSLSLSRSLSLARAHTHTHTDEMLLCFLLCSLATVYYLKTVLVTLYWSVSLPLKNHCYHPHPPPPALSLSHATHTRRQSFVLQSI